MVRSRCVVSAATEERHDGQRSIISDAHDGDPEKKKADVDLPLWGKRPHKDAPGVLYAGHRIGGILDVIRRVREEGVTVLIIEHTMQAMVRLVDEFSVLDHGRLIAAGRPDEIVRDRRVIEAYLGRRWMDRVTDAVA